LGVAVREYQIDVGLADYVLFVDQQAVGVIEAKPESCGEKITKRISIPDFSGQPIPFVGVAKIKELIDLPSALFSRLGKFQAVEERSSLASETLRQSILKKAFSGQLVPQDPNDEPASELLARIKAEKENSLFSKGDAKRKRLGLGEK
jgi:hypothetical protein